MTRRPLSRRAILLALAFLTVARRAQAHSYTAGNLQIGHVWAQPTDAAEASVFFALLNLGPGDDRLLSAACPAATAIEFRRDGAGPPAPAIDLPAGSGVNLRPGGWRLRLLGLRSPLAIGDRLPLTLVFQRAGKIAVEIWVETAPYAATGN